MKILLKKMFSNSIKQLKKIFKRKLTNKKKKRKYDDNTNYPIW